MYNNDGRRAVGYCRVSTDKQGQRGYGMTAQRSAILTEVDRRGWSLDPDDGIYIDVASGKSMRGRPQFQAALETLRAGKAGVLVVAKLDRMSRSLLDFAGIMARSQKEGWAIVALDIGVDTSTPNGELIASIIMALAQWERRVISQRTKDALAVVVERGGKLGRPVSTDADVVGRIRSMHASGHTLHGIARTLNLDRVPTAQGGAAWHASTVRAVINRDDPKPRKAIR